MPNPPLDKVKRYLAHAGITQSAVRLGPSSKGVLGMNRTASNFCAEIKLDQLPSPDEYCGTLDQWTEELRQRFPTGGQFWGTARKCINIFMRDAFYNFYLRDAYSLARFERVLEIPLDGDVAKGLLRENEASLFGLQRWDAIIRVTRDENEKYQRLAAKVADRCGVARVHLDLLYWRPPSPQSK
jgi:hypothetical protein